ncbi:NADPH:quinone reductase [Haladaptatus sp. YSMS36]|uniref:NADPH:quinone reductase n=1 Tax=Haladaptatus sp. YSMS36 TaxID=3033384 RepID=UPI0023E85501|nr:NADPH:quinone reductase [Haladaptatus sp. YSMS36]
MRAVRYHEHGGTDVLTTEELMRPEPAANELLVAVHAAGINPVDTYFREGSYKPATLPWIPGSDVAGVVSAVGDDVTEFKAGDEIYATGLGNGHPGTCAEYATVPVELAASLPDSVSFEQAAAGALVGVTAWQSLIATANLQPAETVLIHGGSGGVGHMAVQIANATGATVVTTASPKYHDDLDAMGADVVLDYARDDLEDAIEEVGKPDVILDHRLDEYLPLDCAVAAKGCRIVAIGNEDQEATFPSVPAARAKALSVHHVSMFNTPDIGDVLSRLATLMEAGALTPRVHQTYDLAEVGAAHDDVLAESFLGKLVVTP